MFQDQYPDHYLKIRAFPTEAPQIRFQSQGTMMHIKYMIYVYAAPYDFGYIKQVSTKS